MLGKIVSGLALAASLTVPALAEGAVRATLEELNACTAVADAQARLACYDKAAPKIRASLDVATEEDQSDLFGLDIFGSSSGGTGEATRPEDFGKKDLPKTETVESGGVVTEITTVLAEYARNPDGYDVYVLDNGQVWREKDVVNLPIPRNLTDVKVRIRTGAMGAFYLSREGTNKSVRVERIR